MFIAVCGISVSLNLDVKNTSGFLNLVSDVDFGFSYLGSGFPWKFPELLTTF